VGKAINPQQVVGQIEGGLVQSVGYAVMENFIEKQCTVLTPSLSTYLVPTVVDVPEAMNIMVLEIPDPRGPWGARAGGSDEYVPGPGSSSRGARCHRGSLMIFPWCLNGYCEDWGN
jgi:CO/xanthine dehydrogenase Mo-binding subunit